MFSVRCTATNKAWTYREHCFYLRFEAFTAVTMKNVVFWDVALCRSADICSSWFPARGFFYPEDGDDTFLRNVS
jgi:hypothetical protein